MPNPIPGSIIISPRRIPANSASLARDKRNALISSTTSPYCGSFCIVFGVPCICINTTAALRAAKTLNIFLSAKPAEISLIRSTPASKATSATLLSVVSTLNRHPAGSLLRRRRTTGITRSICTSADTGSAPGLVDSPPISIISTPSAIISSARRSALSGSKYSPPSEKLSGVTLSIPIMIGCSFSRRVCNTFLSSLTRKPLALHTFLHIKNPAYRTLCQQGFSKHCLNRIFDGTLTPSSVGLKRFSYYPLSTTSRYAIGVASPFL
ncbi:protein of unknown function [Candidatus Methylocalor cossyra]|uniref:Uncharacterized protein n=1 Tax=Candidatus Methylocalor cossyra TaxID=3108543 RepID=A0ABM9NKR6_9GAMM